MVEEIRLSGTWEQRRRNPLVGALILVLSVGTFYFLIQSIVLNAYMMIEGIHTQMPSGGSFQARLRGFYSQYRTVILLLLPATEFGINLLVPVFLIRRWHTQEVAKYLRYDRFPILGVLLGVAGVLAILPSVEYLASFMYSLFPGLKELGEATEPIVRAPNTPALILTVFSVAVAPAICEETLFRGYLQRTLERRIRAPWSFLLSGFLFALFHQRVLSLPSLFLVGIYLGFIYTYFRSIYPGIFAHFAYNGAIIWLSNSQPKRSLLFDGDFTVVALFLSIGAFAVILTVMLLSRRRQLRSES